jgi:hypothetical protein
MEIEELKAMLGLKPEETIKIEKNSKGYNWEYKLVGQVENNIDTRVDSIEQKLKHRFENKQEIKKDGD